MVFILHVFIFVVNMIHVPTNVYVYRTKQFLSRKCSLEKFLNQKLHQKKLQLVIIFFFYLWTFMEFTSKQYPLSSKVISATFS